MTRRSFPGGRCARLFLTAFLLLGVLAPAASGAADTYEIGVILPMTGFAAFIGSNQAQALAIEENVVNRTGGIRGRPVHFKILDDQGSPQVALQLVNGLLPSRPAVILGFSLAAECRTMVPVVTSGPVIYCFSPSVTPPRGSYVFVSSVDVEAIESAFVRFARERGYRKLGLLFPTDASGQISEQTMHDVLARPDNRDMRIVALEHFNPTDISVAAQEANVKAAEPDLVYTTATGSAFGNVLRAVHDGGLNVPVVGTAANMSYEQLAQYAGFLPKELLFNGYLFQEPSSVRGPSRVRIDEFTAAFAAAKVRPSPLHGLAWDPAALIVSALRHLGPSATAPQIRDYLEGLHGEAGINGVYDFRIGNQHGLSDTAVVVVRWDPTTSDFVLVSGPGGQKFAPPR
jgi:branched-chain amino acid transport system substrate-binding protein